MAKKASSTKEDYPKIMPFQDLGFVWNGKSGNEVYGDCPFCGKPDKVYVNTVTQQWQCKNAYCNKEGNLYHFIQYSYEQVKSDMADYDMERLWDRLAADRAIPKEVLQDEGIAWDGNKWWIPVVNYNGTYVNIRFYRIGEKTKNLKNVEVSLLGLNHMARMTNDYEIWMCEGEWDYIAMRDLFDHENVEDAVLAVPGAGIFKDGWLHYFKDKVVNICYDNDENGRKGCARTALKLMDVARKVKFIDWPPELPTKFDIRDFYQTHGDVEVLKEMLKDFHIDEPTERKEDIFQAMTPLSKANRPSFQEVLALYEEHLHMTAEMRDALRIIFAVIYSNQLEGDPLWVHIAGPPGSGKTELLMSTNGCQACEVRSTVTPHSLVSGFQLPGGKDPSLIPHILGKTFILKDFTEVLQMARNSKDEVYHILRGAYDGEVIKQFGNGLVRHYRGYFSMITGVTQAIFAESGTSLGERFLIYHFVKGVGFDADAMIMAAIGNSGEEKKMKSALQEAAKSFLEYQVDGHCQPVFDRSYALRIVGLAQFVAMLRGSVERGFNREQLKFRPQHEMGTRLAKQFKKLLMGLAITNEDYKISEDDYRLVVRIALDTCIGFNLEIVRLLIEMDGSSVREIAEAIVLPLTTCREQLEDMEALHVVWKTYEDNPAGRGAPIAVYHVTDTVKRHWESAKISDYIVHKLEAPRVRKRFRKGQGDES